MKNRYELSKIFKVQNLNFIFLFLVMVLFTSCKNESGSSQNPESDLLTKINAVQEQVMAQGFVTDVEEQALISLCSIVSHSDGLATYTSDNSIILKDVENAPVYNGCEGLSIEENRKCFNTKVASFIKREFNLSITKDLNLSESNQVEAFFIINEEGNVTGLKVRNSEVTVQAEILRVLRKMPVMKPATQNGENVSVLCSVLIIYGNTIDVEVVYIPERPE
jgi:hypothetical protein